VRFPAAFSALGALLLFDCDLRFFKDSEVHPVAMPTSGRSYMLVKPLLLSAKSEELQ
jgi:hypothetical protein